MLISDMRELHTTTGKNIDTKLDEKMNSSSVSLPDGVKPPSNEDVIEEVSKRRKHVDQ